MKRVSPAALKTPIMLLVGALALAAGAVHWSVGQYGDAAAALERAQAAQQAAHARAQHGQRDARLVAEYLDAYRAIIARGYSTEENRLGWIEAVHLANRDARLYGASYTLAPRTPAPGAESALMQTPMRLKMPLLVETDLQRFISALAQRAQTPFRVSECRLTRVTPMPFQAVNVPQLEAECEVRWFTLAGEPREPT